MKPQFDSLEGKCLMTHGLPTITQVGDVAIIQGTPKRDVMVLTKDDQGLLSVTINGQTTALPGTFGVYADLGDGNDVWINKTNNPTVVRGGRGNDYLTTGQDPNGFEAFDVLYGDEGNDRLVGDPTLDYLKQDNDRFDYPQIDVLSNVVFINLDDVANDIVANRDENGDYVIVYDQINTIYVPGYNDVVIFGGDGHDTLSGDAADDITFFD